MIENHLNTLLGFIYTYRGDLRLVMETQQDESDTSTEPTE